MGLSQEHIDIIKATAPVVAENSLKITSTFYGMMFQNNPEVMHFFNKSHQRKKAQPRALADSVVQYALNIEHLDRLGALVARIAWRHCALSIKPEHYAIVHTNLMKAIAEVLGEAVTPEIAEAWSQSVLALAKICIDAEEAIYKQNEARLGGWRFERSFKVLKAETVADVRIIEFAASDGYDGGFDFTPGQYLTLRIPGEKGPQAPRHYTITSAPKDKTFKIAVRLLEGGAMSTYVHNELKEGDEVLLGAPAGVFVPASDKNGVVLVSGGIGVTPMVSFMNHFNGLNPELVKTALHVETNEERNVFKEEFKKALGDKYQAVYARPANIAALSKQLVDKAGPDSDYYVCGPTLFMAAFKDQLEKQGAKNIHMEVFGTGTVETNKASETEAVTEEKGDEEPSQL